MTEGIIFKRGKFCVRQNGKQYKFATELEALEFLGIKPVAPMESLWKDKVSFFSKENDGSSDT